jgi:hypothetical protein
VVQAQGEDTDAQIAALAERVAELEAENELQWGIIEGIASVFLLTDLLTDLLAPNRTKQYFKSEMPWNQWTGCSKIVLSDIKQHAWHKTSDPGVAGSSPARHAMTIQN